MALTTILLFWFIFGWGVPVFARKTETASAAAAVSWPQLSLETPRLTEDDHQLLDQIERLAFRYFWENADPDTGLVSFRVKEDPTSNDGVRQIASPAATGFGLVALAIGHKREYVDRAKIMQRVERTLTYIAERELDGYEGFFYRFVNSSNGERVLHSEVSSFDTALLVAGALTAGHYFDEEYEHDQEHLLILAEQIYDNVNYKWMLNGSSNLRKSWTPEEEFEGVEEWDKYGEWMILLLQGIGSLTHSISPETWSKFERPLKSYAGFTYINGDGPIFTHQYSHAFIDFRGRLDYGGGDGADYFVNSVIAASAHKAFCVNELAEEFPQSYRDNLWGITASDTPHGYDADWGGPPRKGNINGEVVPCAAGGSIPFLPEETLAVLRNLQHNESLASLVCGRYGFVDAFNPVTGWRSSDVIGINVGITMLMAENHRTGFVWQHYMTDEHVERAMQLVGFSGGEAVGVGTSPVAPFALMALSLVRCLICVLYI